MSTASMGMRPEHIRGKDSSSTGNMAEGATPSVSPGRGGKGKKGRKKGRKGPFTPSRGGTGGVAPRVNRGPDWAANARIVLTGASIGGSGRAAREARAMFLASCEETSDPHDRAHNRKKLVGHDPSQNASWMLAELGEIDLPGREPVSRPRRYHRSQMVGTPGAQVSIDSMFDAAAGRARVLEGAGVEMGWHTDFPRARSTPLASRRAQEMAVYFAGRSRDEVRNRLHPRLRQEMSEQECAAQEAGTRMLRANRVDWDGMEEA